ncbi:MAG: site-specific integrase [Bacteroidales bacterium]|jgi:integrase
MNIQSYTLKFILLGKDKKVYLRYFITIDGNPKTLNIPCRVKLSPDQLEMLNEGSLKDTLVHKECYRIYNDYRRLIDSLNHNNNSYPTPKQIKEHLNVTNKQLHFESLIGDFMRSQKIKNSTRKNYSYILKTFKRFFDANISSFSIQDLVHKKTIKDFEVWFVRDSERKRLRAQQNNKKGRVITPLTIHNNVYVIKIFLNHVAEKYDLKKIEVKLKQPKFSSKWHITEEDIERLLEYEPKTVNEQDVIDIIKINKYIGLRINEILNIQLDNIQFNDEEGYAEIRFIEEKKGRERTIIIADPESIEILLNRWLNDKLWNFTSNCYFDHVLKKIAKEQFGDSTVKIYRVNTVYQKYVDVKKCEAISSHAFRRYAASRNISKYGIEFARTMGGWSDYQIITRHYSEFIGKEDLKKKLLKGNSN